MADADPGAAMKLPSGGGALSGIGETFQPDEHTGTGNFSVPIPLLPGRRGAKPSLTLAYSTGNGSGPFGLGWDLAVPSVRRRVAKGVPRYDDAADTFVLSGAEDLVPVAGPAGGTAQARRYRPRTESAFARITHVTGDAGDYWEVRVGDGSTSYYGTPRPDTPPAGWTDPATVVRPDGRIFGWLLSRTVDSCGNVVDYRYQADPAGTGQRYLSEVRYADYDPGDGTGPAYLVSVRLSYAARPDPFSDRKPGFDLRTTLRATAVEVWVTAPVAQRVTTVGLTYADQLGTGPDSALSLLARITVTGHDGAATEQLPPISVEYTAWQPARRRFASLTGELPAAVPGRDGVDLVDLFGDGLPSLLRLDGTACYWRNRGDGSFAPARSLAFAPAGARLGGPTRTAAAVGAAQLLDIDGDGRTDLVRAEAVGTRVWPLAFGGDRAGFDPSGGALRAAPTFGLDDPETRLVDLTGDGTPDLLRGGATMAAAYNDGSGGFTDLMLLPHAPKVSLADPRIRLADMTGDGLTDIVLVRDGAVSYWPSLGYGRWGDPVTMAAAPRFGDPAGGRLTGYDPARLLLGDVTGDGAADLVYVGSDAVTVWLNRSGNGFAPPVVVPGTPRFGGGTTVRLADMSGSGVSGVL